jgi:hypothetical protein
MSLFCVHKKVTKKGPRERNSPFPDRISIKLVYYCGEGQWSPDALSSWRDDSSSSQTSTTHTPFVITCIPHIPLLLLKFEKTIVCRIALYCSLQCCCFVQLV